MNYIEIAAQADEPNPITTGDTEEYGEKPTALNMGGPRFPIDVSWELDYERRVYRRRVVGMMHRYMRYSMDVGRLPSLVGREFFRSKVSKYTTVTFEDRVIFVHDMETCLSRLDDFTRGVLGRVVLQEYDHEEAAQLLGCTRMTVHRKLLEGLDRLTDILLEMDLLSPIGETRKKSCQEGEEAYFYVSDCEQYE